ncbi:MAG: hypothetical protein KJ950_09340 [Proteobacteria bacterium]|nr:hypothetical protein [Pseudomonadota bacterium]MBU1687641.1 hypothetical protein [Pseudomonadota bacterium]
MKIQSIDPATGRRISSAKGSNSGTSLDFRYLLESQLSQTIETAPVSSPVPVAPSTEAGMSSVRVEGLTLTETILDTLEKYGSALSNTTLEISDLEPYVSALEEETLAMLEIRSHLAPEDSLGQLLDRVASLSYMESVKYRRGDYSA